MTVRQTVQNVTLLTAAIALIGIGVNLIASANYPVGITLIVVGMGLLILRAATGIE